MKAAEEVAALMHTVARSALIGVAKDATDADKADALAYTEDMMLGDYMRGNHENEKRKEDAERAERTKREEMMKK